jgi:fatty acid desaturase
VNLAVGIIGSEDNPANLMYGGVLAVSAIGVSIARFQPAGMARALSATAFAQALVGVIALTAGFGSTSPSLPATIVFLTGFFIALWLLSAYLFRKAAREQASAGAAP